MTGQSSNGTKISYIDSPYFRKIPKIHGEIKSPIARTNNDVRQRLSLHIASPLASFACAIDSLLFYDRAFLPLHFVVFFYSHFF